MEFIAGGLELEVWDRFLFDHGVIGIEAWYFETGGQVVTEYVCSVWSTVGALRIVVALLIWSAGERIL